MIPFTETQQRHAEAWKNVPKEKRRAKTWSLLWWVPAAAAFFLVLLDFPWWAAMGVAVFCSLNASKESTVKNLKLIPSLLRDLLAAKKNGNGGG